MKLILPDDIWEDRKEFIWTPGKAKFFTKDAVDYVAKSSGNESIKLTLSITDIMGQNATTWVYLSNKSIYLFKHYCESVGLIEQFKKCEIEPYMCLNKEGICETKVIKNKEGSRYEYKIEIKDFCKPGTEFEEFVDDEIPF